MRILSTLILIISLFSLSGCVFEKEKVIYVYKKYPTLKDRPVRDTKLEDFNLYKQESSDPTMYLVPKEGLIQASKNTQTLRRLVYDLDKDTKFYRYQNRKANLYNKEINSTKKDTK